MYNKNDIAMNLYLNMAFCWELYRLLGWLYGGYHSEGFNGAQGPFVD